MAYLIYLFLAILLLPGGWLTAGPVSESNIAMKPIFVTSDQCMACHNGLITNFGEDVSIGVDWRTSMMANSARDPYWQAAVRREVLDHPSSQEEIENECSACHMPMSRFEAKAAGRKEDIFAHLPIGEKEERSDLLAADGVSCTLCHQVQNQDLGKKESFTAGFAVDTQIAYGKRMIYGPFEVDQGRKRIMRSASGFQPEEASHIQSSEHCATCHTLYTHTLGPNGEVLGELPEQVPYLEWLHSAYAQTSSCQECHMPSISGKIPISSVWGEPRGSILRHVFRAGNFFMPRVLNRYRNQLGVTAQSQEFNTTSRQALEHLQTKTARISIESGRVSSGRLIAEVKVESLAGHKLPTAYPSRRVWIHFTISDRQGNLIFESGALKPDGSIVGNDNDVNPGNYELHHETITNIDHVQIYEAIMVDADNRITTGLLQGLKYIKDNRLLPRGFDKKTADNDIATQGLASDDTNFVEGSDRIRYSVALNQANGPFTIQAELWYQPISYRWAQNLRKQKADEIYRFVTFYESLSNTSAIVLSQISHQISQ